MEPEFWFERWELNEIGFHQPQYNSMLVAFWRDVASHAEKGRVFVPLCGKSRDMLWLHEQGHPVVGIELSSIAVTDFFTEQAIPFEIDEVDELLSYRSQGLSLYCGDFFKLQPRHLAGVVAVYDRAALIALPSELQERYARHLLSILPECTPILLITLEYEADAIAGPPFSTPGARVRELFETACDVEVLARRDVLTEHPGLAAKGLGQLHESAYAIRPRR